MAVRSAGVSGVSAASMAARAIISPTRRQPFSVKGIGTSSGAGLRVRAANPSFIASSSKRSESFDIDDTLVSANRHPAGKFANHLHFQCDSCTNDRSGLRLDSGTKAELCSLFVLMGEGDVSGRNAGSCCFDVDCPVRGNAGHLVASAGQHLNSCVVALRGVRVSRPRSSA